MLYPLARTEPFPGWLSILCVSFCAKLVTVMQDYIMFLRLIFLFRLWWPLPNTPNIDQIDLVDLNSKPKRVRPVKVCMCKDSSMLQRFVDKKVQTSFQSTQASERIWCSCFCRHHECAATAPCHHIVELSSSTSCLKLWRSTLSKQLDLIY